IALGVAALTLGMSSCVDDLNVDPNDPKLENSGMFPSDPDAYMDRVMADVYLQFATYGANGDNTLTSMDGGMSTFQRAIFNLQEIPTDEACWLPVGDAIDHEFQYGTSGQVPANTCNEGAYYRLITNVAIINDFLQTSFGTLTEAQQAKFDRFCRQARILRGACYFYLIDLWGNVPYAGDDVKAGTVAPQLSSDFKEGRRMVFEKVTADLEEIVAWYKTNEPENRPAYGYVGLDVAESLLVKFYLNAEVYTGTPRWADCYSHAEAIINRIGKPGIDGTGLARGYNQLFGADNRRFANTRDHMGENIWIIPAQIPSVNNGVGLQSYANAVLMMHAWLAESPDEATPWRISKAEYNTQQGWKCMVARPQLVYTFDWDDATCGTSPDRRTKFWKTSAHGFQLQGGDMSQDGYGANGYPTVKYTNWYIADNTNLDYALSPDIDQFTEFTNNDYAMIRLAEIYLSAAEAALNGGGTMEKALEYTNYVRARAGLDPYTNLNLPELYNERTRELYSECNRRTDLIRQNRWISGYTWNYKGTSNINGQNYDDRFVVYPIPSSVIIRNGYTQNPQY
ncbi:MAG: RagB/SusD family nutrient uptake outer membrane protein, partial [Muribaculaceae bacterium]|nr:RagB/SusD family nutrient uptake outer membrane protein [Muribaculaceae bacterium]